LPVQLLPTFIYFVSAARRKLPRTCVRITYRAWRIRRLRQRDMGKRDIGGLCASACGCAPSEAVTWLCRAAVYVRKAFTLRSMNHAPHCATQCLNITTVLSSGAHCYLVLDIVESLSSSQTRLSISHPLLSRLPMRAEIILYMSTSLIPS
jgi:hypothetical protein